MRIDTHRHDTSVEEVLAFINTLEHGHDGDEEHLPSLDAAVAWLTEHGVMHAEDGRTLLGSARPESTLRRIRTARSAFREVADAVVAGRGPAPAAIATVNRILRRLDAPTIIATEHGAAVGHTHGQDPLDDALARLALPLAELLETDQTDLLRVCANDECRWVFFDTSRTHRRRWCDMATCGNRAKAARHRARVQGGTI